MKGKMGLVLAGATAAAGVTGVLLRRWQLATAFEADTGLLMPGMPSTHALVALAAVAAAVLLALSAAAFWGECPKGYLANLAAPNLAVGVLTLLAGALVFAGGALGIRDYALGISDSMARLVMGCCMALGGVCVGLIGLLGQQRQEGKGRFALVLTAPGYCACVWLVAAYQGHTANPNVMEYVFLLLGIVCAIFASYGGASFSFEKPRPVLCAFFSAMGAVLLAIAAADEPGGMEQLVIVGYALYLVVQLGCLIGCRLRPPVLEQWTPPPKPETGETETGGEAAQEEKSGEAEEKSQPRGEENE